MEVFSRLFGNKIKQPKKNDWPIIVEEISNGLEKVRNMWFDQCKSIIVSNNRNVVLQGDGLIYAKTYQLYYSFTFIGENKYISAPEGKDFADLLLYKVCENNKEIAMKLGEYQRKIAEPNKPVNIVLFATDITAYITGNAPDIFKSMELCSIMPGFVEATRMVVANSFGDHKTAAKIGSKMMKI